MRLERAACARLRSSSDQAAALRNGIRAVRTRDKKLVSNAQQYQCSVDLAAAMAQAESNSPRWDYILAAETTAVGMEVHAAKGSEVAIVIRKKEWAAALLTRSCGLAVSRWCWVVPTGSRIHLTHTSPEARRLAKNGIEFPSRRLE